MKTMKVIVSIVLIMLCGGCSNEEKTKESESTDKQYMIVELPSDSKVEDLFNVTDISQTAVSEASKTYDSISEKGVFKAGNDGEGTICWQEDGGRFVYAKGIISNQSITMYASMHINDEAISYDEFLKTK